MWKTLKTPEALTKETTAATFAILMESWLTATPNVSPVGASCQWIRCGGYLLDGQPEYYCRFAGHLAKSQNKRASNVQAKRCESKNDKNKYENNRWK